jgi:hypothetical protein
VKHWQAEDKASDLSNAVKTFRCFLYVVIVRHLTDRCRAYVSAFASSNNIIHTIFIAAFLKNIRITLILDRKPKEMITQKLNIETHAKVDYV